jgi:hypothetical protein
MLHTHSSRHLDGGEHIRTDAATRHGRGPCRDKPGPTERCWATGNAIWQSAGADASCYDVHEMMYRYAAYRINVLHYCLRDDNLNGYYLTVVEGG